MQKNTISDKSQTTLALARQRDLYAMLSQTNQAIVRMGSREELFAAVCRIAVEHGHFIFAWIGLIDKTNSRVTPVAKHGEDGGYVEQVRILADSSEAAGRGPTGEALRSGMHVITNDFLSDPATAPWHEVAQRASVRAKGAFPLRLHGVVIGTLNVYASELGYFTEDLLPTLDDMAEDVSFALDNFAREVERSQVVEALRDSETRYRSLFEIMLNGFAYCRMQYDEHNRPVDFVYLSVNDAFGRLTGLKDVVGRKVSEVIPGIRESSPEIFEIYGRVASSGIPEAFEIDFKPLAKWLIISVYSPRTGYFVAIFDDITATKKMEQALRESEERLREIFEGARDGILVADAETGKFVIGNPAICRELGYTLEELVQLSVPDIHRTEDLPHAKNEFERQRHGGAEIAPNVPVMRKDGSVFYADIQTTVIRLGGKNCQLGIFRDVTKRKLAEEALARESQRNQAFLRNASDGVHVLDTDGTVLEVSDSFCIMLGYSREEMIGANISLWDAQWSPQELKQLIGEQIAKTGRSILQTRHRRRDGSMLDVEVTGHGLELDGKPVLFNSARDITERIRSQQKLVDAEAQFRGLVEQSIAGIYIIQDGKFAYVNPRCAEIIGLGSAEDLIGSDPLRWVAKVNRRQVAENMRRLLASEARSLALDFGVVHRGGKVIQVGANAARATHEGRPAIIGLLQDISEKRRAEEQIQHYVAQLQTAFMSTVEVATTLSEMRDPYTTGHERRVAEIAVAIGAELGLDQRQQEGLRVAGYLHDVGKITVPAEILSKPGKLSPIEYELIKGHAQASYDVLKDVEFPWPVAQIALQHHERMDGSGYPQGLKGTAIMLEARVMAVADVVEAMSSHRPYRAALGIDVALAEIERGRGTVYDPVVAAACLKMFREKSYTLPA